MTAYLLGKYSTICNLLAWRIIQYSSPTCEANVSEVRSRIGPAILTPDF